MSITLHELLEWRDRLSEDSGEDADMVRMLIARREAELRTHIASLVALVSERENWKLKRCAMVARRVEQASIVHLEAIHDYFRDRSEGRAHCETPDMLADFLAGSAASDGGQVEESVQDVKITAGERSPLITDLHGRMQTLESRVANAPGLSCGVQGIRIMRMVALMSKARFAEIAKMRVSGMQAIYRHA
ncbi:hypothetical protein [Caballeronia ptereochthonis]|uniref:Uncharacterized protein n=1 Tax=Caballeronia ptereochthonis TaxID=1777144 RepID=A0A158A754_9BURK|nr:hypothetical protein [Caballeronia ptereochthonis]SAK52927.1 hypothetical protein AWB83_01332 [Caballeronia ptereochthonis]